MKYSTIIVLRQSPDWGALDYTYLDGAESFERMAGLPFGFVKKLVMTWDNLYNVKYFEIRQKLKDICLNNLSCVEDALVVPFDNLGSYNLSEYKLFLFTDDDDWFDPNVVASLLNETEGEQGIIWNSQALREGMLTVRDKPHCFTNNYAITAKYFDGVNQMDALSKVLQHMWANNVFFGEEELNYRYVRKSYSVANKHPCSPSALFHIHGPDYEDTTLIKYLLNYQDNMANLLIPEDMLWATPYINEVRELFTVVTKDI